MTFLPPYLSFSALRRAGRSGLVLAGFLPLLSAAQPANGAAEIFKKLHADNWVARTVTLSELGFTGPLVLGAPETRRAIQLPVPANVPLSGGEIKMNGSYMRADGGRTSLVVSLDTYPVSSRPFSQDKGDASLLIGVDGLPRPAGFVRLGLDWSTALGAEWICADGRAPGNILRIEPDTRFSYRYDANAVRDLTTAWGALPTVPVILISSKNLGSQAYDSAWKMGVALERAGKRSKIVALPVVGDTIDLQDVVVPVTLNAIPAFAGLAQGGMHKLANVAEVAALLSLGASKGLRGDIVIADKAMAANMATAFDALAAQVQTSAPDALPAFNEWCSRAFALSTRASLPNEVKLTSLLGQPAIVISDDAGSKAAGLFSTYWNKVAVSPLMVVQAADVPRLDAAAVSLKYLGGKPGSFDVLAHADWTAGFDIGAVAADGRLPATLVLDVSAAPSAARTPPVVSIFLNDILLGAKQMDANGKPERITAPVPQYALAARNVLKVSFTRQLASDRCRETPEAYPVSVLPSSHMLLDKATPGKDFTGMVSRYAAGAHVMVPAAYLADAANTLPRLIRVAASTGVSPVNAQFTAINGQDLPAPGGAFLAMELPFKPLDSSVKIDSGRVVLASSDKKVFFDATGLNNVGVIDVVSAGSNVGVLYRNAGAQAPQLDKPLLLSYGNVAVIGQTGVISEINTSDPSGSQVPGGVQRPWMLTGGYWWLLPILAVVFMIALLVFASRVRRRRAAEQTQP